MAKININNTSIDMMTLIFEDIRGAKLINYSNTLIVVRKEDGNIQTFQGNFIYDANNKVSAGSITNINEKDKNGNVIFDFSELNLKVSDYINSFENVQLLNQKILQGNDFILGGTKNDKLIGGAGNDIIDGGAGDDIINGGVGADTYIIGLNSGNDVIESDVYNFLDKIQISKEYCYIKPEPSFSRNNDDLILTVTYTTMDMFEMKMVKSKNTLTLKNWYIDTNSKITDFIVGDIENGEKLSFDNFEKILPDNQINIGTIKRDYIVGDDTNNNIDGGAGNDIIRAMSGDDNIVGGAGSDIYIFGPGSGTDIIKADIYNYLDTIKFEQGEYDDFEPRFSQKGKDLILVVNYKEKNGNIVESAKSTVIMEGWFDNNSKKITKFLIGDNYEIVNNFIKIDDKNKLTISGGSLNDYIIGGDSNDKIYGNNGDDFIFGGRGNDEIYGGAGNDLITGDLLDGIIQTNDTNKLYAGAGNDELWATFGNNFLYGENGDDELIIEEADGQENSVNYLYGGNGMDTLVSSGNATNYLYGGNDDDEIQSYGAKGVLIGGAGDDSYRVAQGIIRNSFEDSSGWDQVLITQVDGCPAVEISDYDYKVENNNFIMTLKTDSTVKIIFEDWLNHPVSIITMGFNTYESWREFVEATGVAKWYDVTGSGESIFGDNNKINIITGGLGNEKIVGGNRADIIVGGAGNDIIEGGAGDDRVNGGSGADIYVIGLNSGNDVILADAYNYLDKIQIKIEDNYEEPETTFVRVNDDLILTVTYTGIEKQGQDPIKSNSTVTLKNWYSSVNYKITDFIVGDINQGFKLSFDNFIQISDTNKQIISGTNKRDYIRGGLANDTIYGGEGNDKIRDSYGNNKIYGGNGNDDLYVGGCAGKEEEINYLYGENGDDSIGAEGKATNILDGGAGKDTLSSLSNSSVLIGGAGDDQYFVTGGTIRNAQGDISGKDIVNILNNEIDEKGNENYQYKINDNNIEMIDGSGNKIVFEDFLSHPVVEVRFADKVYTWNEFLIEKCKINIMVAGKSGKDNVNEGLENFNNVIGGTGAANVISGANLTDRIDGGAGDDIINGGEGNDYIKGGSGADTIDGGYGNDSLSGGDGNDNIKGGSGEDIIDGGTGNDIISGGVGNDIITGGAGADTYVFKPGDGADTIIADVYNYLDTITIDSKDCLYKEGKPILRKNGNDLVLIVKYFNDQGVEFSNYKIDLTLKNWFDSSSKRINKIVLSGKTYTIDNFIATGDLKNISGTSLNDFIEANSSSEKILANAGNDIIYARGNIEVDGGLGNDTIIATFNDDKGSSKKLCGGDGNDYIKCGLGNNEIHGGKGDDKLIVEAFEGENNSFNFLMGEAGDDYLLSLSDSNTLLEGGEGNDILESRGNKGILIGGSGNDKYILSEGIINNSVNDIYGNDTVEIISKVEGIILNITDYNYKVENGRLVMVLKDNNKTSITFEDCINHPVSSMKIGDKTYTWKEFTQQTGKFEYLECDGSGNDVKGIDDKINIIGGSNKRDIIYGGNNGDLIQGGDGDDVILGEQGNDVLYGGNGNDEIYGGLGDDILYGGSGSDKYRINITNSGFDTIVGDSSDSILLLHDVDFSNEKFEISAFKSYNDARINFSYGDVNNTLVIKNYFSGAKISTFYFEDVNEKYIINNYFYDNTVSNYYGSTSSDFIQGDDKNNIIDAKDGNDIINGGLGDDILNGGNGNDILYGGVGSDILNGGTGNNVLYGGVGNDTLTCGNGNDVIYGGSGDDTINAGAGDDIVYTGEGKDIINGGLGLNRYHIDKYDGWADNNANLKTICGNNKDLIIFTNSQIDLDTLSYTIESDNLKISDSNNHNLLVLDGFKAGNGYNPIIEGYSSADSSYNRFNFIVANNKVSLLKVNNE